MITPEEIAAFNQHVGEHLKNDARLHRAILSEFFRMCPCEEHPISPAVALIEGLIVLLLEEVPLEQPLYKQALQDRFIRAVHRAGRSN